MVNASFALLFTPHVFWYVNVAFTMFAIYQFYSSIVVIEG